MKQLWIFLLLSSLALAQPPEYVISEGGQSNVFLDDSAAQVHLLLRHGRLVFAFPSEHSGMGVWFDGQMEIVGDTLRSLPANQNSQVVEVKLRVLRPTTVSKVVLDSIRTLRDESEGASTMGELDRARGSDVAEDLIPLGSGLYTAHFSRQQRCVAPGAGEFELDIAPCTRDSQGYVLLAPGVVTVTARLPFPPLAR